MAMAAASTQRELARELRQVLGPELTALIAESAGTAEIADAKPTSPRETTQRLEAAHQIVELLRGLESPEGIRAWFLGLNPLLDDTPPAIALATDPDAVLKTAHALAAHE